MRLSLSLVFLTAAVAHADNWPGWRGPTGQGHCTETKLPTKWSATENVKWKVALPDQGNSTPVVWGDKVFVTQAADKTAWPPKNNAGPASAETRMLLCFRRSDGKELWRAKVEYKPKESTHGTNPFCSASPATDGKRVVVSHGSAGVYCYDLDGNELWRRDLGAAEHIWGNAASPVLYKDLVILNFGPGERTFLTALDKNTGKDVWKVEEKGSKPQEYIGSWSTPVIADVKGRTELVMSWPGVVKAYNPDSGSLLWESKGLERDGDKGSKLVYTSPLLSADAVVAMAGFGGPSMALKTGGSGDVTDTHRLWRKPGNPQRIGSGVIVGDHVYVANEPGLACLEWKTGKQVWNEPVSPGIWGSLVHADGKLYVTDQSGETWVVAAKPTFELISRNPLGKEQTRASIAASDGELFIRTYKHLWCIAEKK